MPDWPGYWDNGKAMRLISLAHRSGHLKDYGLRSKIVLTGRWLPGKKGGVYVYLT
jgi:hypothetical protein